MDIKNKSSKSYILEVKINDKVSYVEENKPQLELTDDSSNAKPLTYTQAIEISNNIILDDLYSGDNDKSLFVKLKLKNDYK
jgi:hypothetical protein